MIMVTLSTKQSINPLIPLHLPLKNIYCDFLCAVYYFYCHIMKKEIRNNENGLENVYLEIMQVKNTHPSVEFGNGFYFIFNTHTFWFLTGGQERGDAGQSFDEAIPAGEEDRCTTSTGQTREGNHQEEPHHSGEAVRG